MLNSEIIFKNVLYFIFCLSVGTKELRETFFTNNSTLRKNKNEFILKIPNCFIPLCIIYRNYLQINAYYKKIFRIQKELTKLLQN